MQGNISKAGTSKVERINQEILLSDLFTHTHKLYPSISCLLFYLKTFTGDIWKILQSFLWQLLIFSVEDLYRVTDLTSGMGLQLLHKYIMDYIQKLATQLTRLNQTPTFSVQHLIHYFNGLCFSELAECMSPPPRHSWFLLFFSHLVRTVIGMLQLTKSLNKNNNYNDS